MQTIGDLIDKLSIINIKIWTQETIKRDETKSDSEIANATRKVNILNQQRCDLVDEINDLIGKIILGKTMPKTYKEGYTKDYQSKL